MLQVSKFRSIPTIIIFLISNFLIAQNQNSELFIHRPNGKIREANTYGKDPYPPKG